MPKEHLTAPLSHCDAVLGEPQKKRVIHQHAKEAEVHDEPNHAHDEVTEMSPKKKKHHNCTSPYCSRMSLL